MRKRLEITHLEERATPATFTVTTTADSGAGSLRAAITSANSTAGADTITFSIGTGAQTITPATALPNITEAVTIDSTTQPNFGGTPLIRLNGASAGAGSNGLNFVNHNNSTVKSLVIGGFSGAGIRLSGGGSHTILGSFLGTTQTGTAAQANGVGVLIENGSLGNRVGGNGTNERNIISGNTGAGVRIDNAYTTLVAGNFIGTDVNGTSAVPNQGGGVIMLNGAAGSTIGGVSPGLGNIISGNATAGVLLQGASTSGNIIAGNRVGLDFGGLALANTGPGIKAFGAAGSAPPGGTAAGSENTIRGNTIAKNAGAGVTVFDTSRQVRIENNSIRDNGGLGIQVDTTANAGLKAPTITSIKATTGGQNLSGTFSGVANTKYTVNIYMNGAADPSGFGEGQTFLNTVTILTNASGAGTFTVLIPTGTVGAFASATTTHETLGDTSAFSNAFARPDTVLTSATYAVGGGSGGPPTVVLTDSIGTTIRTGNVFEEGFHGGVRVATNDLTGDGIPDIAIGTGVGTKAEVRVVNGATQETLFTVNPFGDFTRGVFVALGDLTHDGYADLVITPDEGGGPRARIYNGKTFAQIADFFGIDDVNFRGGARAAIGDMDNDGTGDLAVSAGFGGGPRIAVFSGATLGTNGGPKLFGDFFIFETTLRNGAFVAMADVNNDGFAELFAAAGPGGAPRVRIINGKALFQSQGQTRTVIADFFAGDINNRAGVRIMARDFDNDGRSELVTGQADGSRVTVFRGSDLVNGNTSKGIGFDLFAARTGGTFVG